MSAFCAILGVMLAGFGGLTDRPSVTSLGVVLCWGGVLGFHTLDFRHSVLTGLYERRMRARTRRQGWRD